MSHQLSSPKKLVKSKDLARLNDSRVWEFPYYFFNFSFIYLFLFFIVRVSVWPYSKVLAWFLARFGGNPLGSWNISL